MHLKHANSFRKMKNKKILIPIIVMMLFSLRTEFLVLNQQIGELEIWRICFSVIGFLFFLVLFILKIRSMRKNSSSHNN